MKAINDPGPIKLVDVLGEPVYESPGKQAEATLSKFLLGLLATPEFVGELKGMDAAVLVLEARKAILAWPPGPGAKALENEHHAAFVRSIKTTQFQQHIAHNFVPFMAAVVDAKDGTAALVPPAEAAAA